MTVTFVYAFDGYAEELTEVRGSLAIGMVVPEELEDADIEKGITITPLLSIVSNNTVYELEFRKSCKLVGINKHKDKGMPINLAGQDVIISSGGEYLARGNVTSKEVVVDGEAWKITQDGMPVKKMEVIYFEYIASGSGTLNVDLIPK